MVVVVVVLEYVVGEEWEKENLTRCMRDHEPERKKIMICGVYKNVQNTGRRGSAI